MSTYRRTQWEKIKIDSGAFESADVFDVNNDGVLDIVCGGWWYEGPDFKTKHKICDPMAAGEYYDDFSTIPMDVNGDGYLDFITGGWWGETLYWRENPKGGPGEWTTHEISKVGNIETTRAWDIDGDGVAEIFPNTPGSPVVFFKLELDSNGKGTGKFRKVVIDEKPCGHGLGFGDISGKGTMALVTPKGWYEMPADPLTQPWPFHPEFELGSASVPVIVTDFNGDGLPELIVGQAHGYGLDYYQQQPDGKGGRTWTRHAIDPYFSQYHEMHWLDIDGDGQPELVTGNRYRAHCGGDKGEIEEAGVYIFKWNGECFTKQVVDHGKAGEASGTGIYMRVIDLDGNGRLDIVAPGKEGLFIFKNHGPETIGDKKE